MGTSDELRLRSLVAAHSSRVAEYLRRRAHLLSDLDTEELLGEVFLVAWRRLDQIPADAEVAWLIGVARNVQRNARRKEIRRTTMMAKLRPRTAGPSAEDLVVSHHELQVALLRLSSSDRELLFLRYWDGLTIADIAVALTIKPTVVAKRLSRAVARLESRIESFAHKADTQRAIGDVQLGDNL